MFFSLNIMVESTDGPDPADVDALRELLSAEHDDPDAVEAIIERLSNAPGGVSTQLARMRRSTSKVVAPARDGEPYDGLSDDDIVLFP